MKRILRYSIQEAEQGKNILLYLKEKGYSKKVITNLKKQSEGIRLNGASTFVNAVLCKDDELVIQIVEKEESQTIIPEFEPIAILYEDEDILVVDKPAGMPVHPSINHHTGTLANRIRGYYKKQGISYVFRCLNRLDRDTSGVVLLAKNILSGAILSKYVKSGELHREYRAIVCGKIPEKGTIIAPIGRKEGSIIEREVNFECGSEAITHYTRIGYNHNYSYVSIQLETGRTHQIRVHMKYIGHPLPGDFLYYPDFSAIGRQALHSYRIWFPHPITGEKMEFVAKMPEDMERLIKKGHD